MALSLSNFLIPSTVFLLYGRICAAATVTYDLNISWVEADPAGIGSTRSVIGINGQWPLPPIEVTKGDQVIINAYNGLGNETTSLHFHGIFMNGSTHMDGAAQVSQCAIPTGGRFTYNFTVDQPGTYWYHSHVKGQYPDGLRGPFIIRDPDNPHKDLYDEERILTISDWYHDMDYPLLKAFMSYTNPTGAEPVPDVALMNDTQNLHINVQPGKTYMFRMVNMAAFAAQYFWIEGHTMRIVEVDGVYTEPTEAKMLYLTAAQRYSILVTMKNDTSSNFAVVGSMDTDMFDTLPNGLNANVTGWLVYDESKPLPAPTKISEFDPFDDFTLVPEDGEKIFDKVDYTMTLDLKMDNLGDGANYAFFNDVSYTMPKVPTLYTALSSGASATNVEIYGHNTNSFVLRKNDIVEIVLNNNDPGKHPFHLHGHNFQVVSRSDTDAGPFDVNNASMTGAFPNAPMRRDTILVHPNSNLVLRFRADNPGIWLFHCHIEWHTASGLIATLIESPLDLQSSLSIPQDHWDVCNAQQIPTKGNAAGNTADLLDLKGEPSAPPPLPAGFTARGIVALVFSCVCAFLGMAAIVWYGAAPITAEGKATGSANGHDAAANGSTEASKATALETVAQRVN